MGRLEKGKLPEALLSPFLSGLKGDAARLTTPPAVGEDTGAAELGNGNLLVYTSDPITFSAKRIGRASVIINANDIATSGGKPGWYLATLLVPPGTPVPQVQAILNDIAQTCSSFGISLAGGHTEISDAVTRPVVSGTMFSIIRKERYINKKNAGAGDTVLVTKTAGLEGAALLAEEAGEKLVHEGLSIEEIDQARGFFDEISIVKEAGIAVKAGGVTAMHDVTEGGVATALRELSAASGRELACRNEAIPIHPLTRKICAALEIDPFGLLGSGSLLICCKEEASASIIHALRKAGIEGAAVGTLGKQGVCSPDLPEFPVDEITKVL